MLVEKPTFGELAVFNQIYKEMDETYHLYAKQHGLSDANLWLLYSLYESEALTQKEICSVWHYSPQTINSALKNLEKQGLLVLEEIPGNRKNNRVALTETGRELTETVILPLILAEQKAFRGLQKEERSALLALTQKYIKLLQAALHLMDPSLPEDRTCR